MKELIDKILEDLHSQEVCPERHPVMYSPWQVQETLTRFLSNLSSITLERSNHETSPRGNTSED
jgi:hypothetical protein